jgi:hypothetical protein
MILKTHFHVFSRKLKLPFGVACRTKKFRCKRRASFPKQQEEKEKVFSELMIRSAKKEKNKVRTMNFAFGGIA